MDILSKDEIAEIEALLNNANTKHATEAMADIKSAAKLLGGYIASYAALIPATNDTDIYPSDLIAYFTMLAGQDTSIEIGETLKKLMK